MKLVDSNKRQLSEVEIIAVALSETGSKFDPKVAIPVITAEATQPGAKLYKIGNTLIISHAVDGVNAVYFRPLNADIALMYAKNLVEYLEELSAEGVELAFTRFSDRKLIPLVEQVHRRFTRSSRARGVQSGAEITDIGGGVWQVGIKLR